MHTNSLLMNESLIGFSVYKNPPSSCLDSIVSYQGSYSVYVTSSAKTLHVRVQITYF